MYQHKDQKEQDKILGDLFVLHQQKQLENLPHFLSFPLLLPLVHLGNAGFAVGGGVSVVIVWNLNDVVWFVDIVLNF